MGPLPKHFGHAKRRDAGHQHAQRVPKHGRLQGKVLPVGPHVPVLAGHELEVLGSSTRLSGSSPGAGAGVEVAAHIGEAATKVAQGNDGFFQGPHAGGPGLGPQRVEVRFDGVEGGREIGQGAGKRAVGLDGGPQAVEGSRLAAHQDRNLVEYPADAEVAPQGFVVEESGRGPLVQIHHVDEGEHEAPASACRLVHHLPAAEQHGPHGLLGVAHRHLPDH